jgi:mannan endo-1,4-beta-mannosidase
MCVIRSSGAVLDLVNTLFSHTLYADSQSSGTQHADFLWQISWGQTSNPQAWGTQWITDHATSQTKAGKPVIIEEFGVTDSQATVYTAWYNQIVSSGLTGDLIWYAC